MKLIEPKIEDRPRRCAPKAQSVWPSPLKSVESGGYEVQPASAGADEVSQQHDHARGRDQPEGKSIQPGKSHVFGTELQGHDIIAVSRPHRDDEEKDHDRAVHGKHAVVGRARYHQVQLRRPQLQADAHRQRSAHDEEEQGGYSHIGRQ